MKRKLTISASFSGVLPLASFENLRPGFSAQEEFEFDGKDELVDDVIKTRQSELQAICYQNFEAEAEKARIQKVQNDLKNCRFYPTEDGDKYISVTSFLNYDKDFHGITDEELKQYGAQGTIIDWGVRNYVKTGKWVDSKDEPSLAAERFIIKSGKLQLALGGWNFIGFLEKFPIKNLTSCEKPVFNHQFKYAGTPDLIGEYEGLKTLISIKRTKSETDNFVQDSCYAKCVGMEDVKQILVCELKSPDDGGNKQGFSKPSVTQDIDRYFELAKYKRNEFRKIYGV